MQPKLKHLADQHFFANCFNCTDSKRLFIFWLVGICRAPHPSVERSDKSLSTVLVVSYKRQEHGAAEKKVVLFWKSVLVSSLTCKDFLYQDCHCLANCPLKIPVAVGYNNNIRASNLYAENVRITWSLTEQTYTSHQLEPFILQRFYGFNAKTRLPVCKCDTCDTILQGYHCCTLGLVLHKSVSPPSPFTRSRIGAALKHCCGEAGGTSWSPNWTSPKTPPMPGCGANLAWWLQLEKQVT